MNVMEGAMPTVLREVCLSGGLEAFALELSLEPVPVDVNRLVAETIATVRGTILAGTEVRLALSHASAVALVDSERMNEAIVSLVGVLVRAFEHGADVLRIETSRVNMHPDDDSLSHPGGYVHFRFHCIGAGAHPEALGDAPRPPCAGDRTLQHSGCGLASIADFVRRSSGRFVVGKCTGEEIDLDLYLPQTTRPSQPLANA